MLLLAIAITRIIAWFYVTYGELSALKPFLEGIKPTVLTIILAAVIKLRQKSVKNTEHWVMAAMVIALSLIGVSEIVAMLSVLL